MTGTLASAAAVLVGALLFGQAVLRLCGAQAWSWFSAPIGAAALMLLTIPAIHFPGRSAGTAIVLAVAVVAALAVLLRAPRQLPPLTELAAALPVALLTTLPFVAAGRVGTLGWSFNNDMATHLRWAEAYRSELVATVNGLPPDYPLGAHALVATLAQGFGVGVDVAFAGLTAAVPALLGLTALSVTRNLRVWGATFVVTLVGMPFLVAGYFGQGSFKELLQALFVLGAACWLARRPPLRPSLTWIPFAMIVAGSISVYSIQGAAWPVAFLLVWAAGSLAAVLPRPTAHRAVTASVRAEAVGIVVGAAALLVALIPQGPRILAFFQATSADGTGIAVNDLGNLAGRLPLWQAFGIWGSADYRVLGADPLTDGIWAAFAAGLSCFGAVWALRRREWVLVGAALAAFLIWVVADRAQSPYVAAKALVILAPLLLLLAVRPLVERDARMPSWWWVAAPALALVLTFKGVGSSVDALRFSKVGPESQLAELRALRPMLGQRPTLFLGNDDFLEWETAGARVAAPVISYPRLTLREGKPWTYGQNYDIDSLDAATINGFDWVITPRDAAASAMPAEMRVVRRTRSFDLYRRTATVPQREILAEGEGAAAPLDCATPPGRAIRAGGGFAGVRGASVTAPAVALAPGAETTVVLPLTAGQWDLVTPYVGERELRVRAAELDVTLPVNLGRPGPRWPIGRITVARRGPVAVRLSTDKGWLTPASAVTYPEKIIAVPVGTARTVPVAAACGKAVDWFKPAGS